MKLKNKADCSLPSEPTKNDDAAERKEVAVSEEEEGACGLEGLSMFEEMAAAEPPKPKGKKAESL